MHILEGKGGGVEWLHMTSEGFGEPFKGYFVDACSNKLLFVLMWGQTELSRAGLHKVQ